MTLAYFDSSALVKLVVDERGSDHAAALWDGADAVLTSRVAHPEVCAALAAAGRGGRLTGEALERAGTRWVTYHRSLRLVELTAEVEALASEIAGSHRLSGSDAIHLASAVAIDDPSAIVASWDARLIEAARAVGFATLPEGVE